LLAVVAVAVAVAANILLLGIAAGPKDPVGTLSPHAGLVVLPPRRAAPTTTTMVMTPPATTTIVTTTTKTSPAPAIPTPITTPRPPPRRGESPSGLHQDD
jgi:hypothetical protein